jgi:hypothetical protein
LTESSQEEGKKLHLDNPSKRQEYLDLIDQLLETAYTKAQGKYCKNSERISWIRAITGLINVGATVLSDQDIDQLIQRIEALEKQSKRSDHV